MLPSRRRHAVVVALALGAPALLAQEPSDDGLALPDVDTSGIDAAGDDPVPAPGGLEVPVPGGPLELPPAAPVAADDPARGWTAWTEGLTWSPVIAPLNLAVSPGSQAWFDSYVPFAGDEGGAWGLWLGYQGTGVAGLATMGAAAAANALFSFPPDEALPLALALGGFNDRSPLAVGAGLVGLYGRVGGVSLAVGGSGALEAVPVLRGDGGLDPSAFGAGLGVGAELGVALWDDGHLLARTSVSQIGAFETPEQRHLKVEPSLGVMVQLFGTPLVVSVGAAIVAPDGRDPIIAPRIFFGGGFDDEPRHDAPALPERADDPAAAPPGPGT